MGFVTRPKSLGGGSTSLGISWCAESYTLQWRVRVANFLAEFLCKLCNFLEQSSREQTFDPPVSYKVTRPCCQWSRWWSPWAKATFLTFLWHESPSGPPGTIIRKASLHQLLAFTQIATAEISSIPLHAGIYGQCCSDFMHGPPFAEEWETRDPGRTNSSLFISTFKAKQSQLPIKREYVLTRARKPIQRGNNILHHWE